MVKESPGKVVCPIEKPTTVIFFVSWAVFVTIALMYFFEYVTLQHIENRENTGFKAWWRDAIYLVQMLACAIIVAALFFFKKTHLVEVFDIAPLATKSTVISDKLDAIGLTSAERDVALLMIKGYTQRETADIQNIALATVKGHCTAIYRKSDTGRAAQFVSLFVDLLIDEQHNSPENTGSTEQKEKRPAA